MGKSANMENFLELAIAFTSEQEINRIFDRILSVAMDLTNCDGGTVYLKKGNELHFESMHTRSKNLHMNALYNEIFLPPVPLNPRFGCARAVLNKETINIPDVYEAREFDFSGSTEYDAMNHYRTGSMLVIPMINDLGVAMGAVQLINAMDPATGQVIPFSKELEVPVFAMTSLASVALHNRMLSKEVSDILHSFVRVMINAIDTRSPYNAHHTKSMVNYATRFLYWQESQVKSGALKEMLFPEEMWDPFLMSIWLHDLGKLVTPATILDKRTRLGIHEQDVLNRLEIAMLSEKVVYLENKDKHPEEAENARSREEALRDAKKLILAVNDGQQLSDETVSELRRIGTLPCRHANGSYTSLLNEEELDALTVRHGTLSSAERKIVQKHVSYTESMLGSMQFSGTYAPVPAWASGHHEFLDGTGYPHGKRGGELSMETRFITILDIYDALTAEDRPYKPAIPPEEAFIILYEMADEGKLDRELVRLFEQSKAWN